jgi:nucleoid-associated protein YgaU
MNEHAGPACALSVVIVGIFAVLLHDRDLTESVSKPIARASPEVPSKEVAPPSIAPTAGLDLESRPAIASTPSTIPAEAIPAPGQAPSVARASKREPPGPVDRPTARPTEADRPSKRKDIPDQPRPAQPRTSFTVVLSGETLADVAARVYGSAGSIEAVWKANRDLLARIDSPLPPGTLLRTP